jgi:hypothetical protein
LNADPQASAYPETFSRRAGWRLMTEDPGTLRARLNKLAALVVLARLVYDMETKLISGDMIRFPYRGIVLIDLLKSG